LSIFLYKDCILRQLSEYFTIFTQHPNNPSQLTSIFTNRLFNTATMQFYTIVSLFLAGTAYALPATSPNGYEACPSGGLFGNPQCCSLNLVGVLSGDCRSRELIRDMRISNSC
jgi:hypothetical protein